VGLVLSAALVVDAGAAGVEVVTDPAASAARLAQVQAECRRLAEDAAAAKRVVSEPAKASPHEGNEQSRGLFGGLRRSGAETGSQAPPRPVAPDQAPAPVSDKEVEQAYARAYGACMAARGYPES
jgi:hypothetical protein